MFGILVLLPLISVAPIDAAEVSATRLDGTSIVGELRSWDEVEAVIDTAKAEERVATDELISLRWSTSPPEVVEPIPTSVQIELIDGSVLPIVDFRSKGKKATATLSAPLPSGSNTLILPRKLLAAVRLQPLDAAAAAQWNEIVDLNLASDVLVLLKREGKSLDYVEGVLGDVSPNKIEFKLDGEPVRIDRTKVAGFLHYRAENWELPEPRCVVYGRSGLRAKVTTARLADGLVQMTIVAGLELNWPLEDFTLADFSAGKLVYLSDIEPASQRWTPLVGLPSGATLAAEYGEPRRNQSAYGGPLTLLFADVVSQTPVGEPRQFSKGLAIRSRTELVYRLPAGFRSFTAMAGIDPATSANGNVRLELFGDDRPLLAAEIAGHDPPRPIEVDIAGVKRLKIVVDYGRNLDAGDWLNLCDARIVK